MRIAVINYGMGNLRSVAKALARAAPQATVHMATDAAAVRAADRVVFPGQGAMPDCMAALKQRNLCEAVLEAARNKPFLGICVGAQLLFEYSEEGPTPGLGLFSGHVQRFALNAASPHSADGSRLKVPHMGWNTVSSARPHSHPLWAGIPEGARFYFVHSFHFANVDTDLACAYTEHGVRFPSAVGRGNIFATQFHPEKSDRLGLQLLENFVRWSGEV